MSGGGLLVSRLSILETLWMNHNRDPFKNKALFEHQLKELAHVEDYVLAQAVDILSNEDVFPKLKKILHQCLLLTPKMETGSVDCNMCGSMGLVLGVVYTFESSTKDVISYNHKPHADGNYTTRVIGRCSCENGLAYQFVKTNVMGKIVKPDQYLMDAAIENGWDANFEANMAAEYFRKKARGIKSESLSAGPLTESINNIIGEANEN